MRLSVVVTIVDARDALERCLTALGRQEGSIQLEVIVPWDDTVADVASTASRFPAVRFLAMGAVRTARPPQSAAGRHELFDRRRATGLRAATGELVAIVEDRCVPRPDWAQAMVRQHERLPHAVIGGAIENARDTPRHWAVFLCDFGRYQRPFEPGPRQWVSDINVGYKRRALDQTSELWRERYHETTVHWALRRAGETLFLTPEVVVDHVRGPLPLSALIVERFAWGRIFAYTRAREMGVGKRLAFLCLTPLLPLLLFGRQLRLQFSKRVPLGTFVAASPYIVALLVAWSAGEAMGYLTAEP
jgi:hypothetical protein